MLRRCALLATAVVVVAACSSGAITQPNTATDGPAAIPTSTIGSTSSASSTADITTTSTQPPLASLPVMRFELDLAVGGWAGTEGLTGGLGHQVHMVTSAADDGPGTYREALSEGDRIVRFDPSLAGSTIELETAVETSASNITIDGSGAGIVVSGYATRFSGTNIVVAGLSFVGSNANEEADAITFREPESTQVFGLFGNTFERAADGLVDIIWNQGNEVYATICDNAFRHHDKAMLIDSGEDGKEGGVYRVTLCRNHWLDIYQRMPFSRNARVHHYNSVFDSFGDPNGNGGGSKSGGDGEHVSQHLLEGNMVFPRAEGETTFDGSRTANPRAEWAAPHLDSDGAVRASGNYLATVGDVTAVEEENDQGDVVTPPYPYTVTSAGPELADVIRAHAGTCLQSFRDDAVNPCAPLLIDDPDGRLEVASSTDPTVVSSVVFVVDGREQPAESAGFGRWALDISSIGPAPVPVWAVARAADGREIQSDLVLVANVG